MGGGAARPCRPQGELLRRLADVSPQVRLQLSLSDPCSPAAQLLGLPARRPEINARHNAFQRGSAYLERYCMLIAFTSYLQASASAPCG